jgi:hypothetical protein
MNDLLKSVKADLTDRRLLPLVAVVLVALVAAVAYAALGGGSSSPTQPAGSTVAPVAAPKGIVVSESQPAATAAVAETTDGTKSQRQGSARNPFTPLPSSGKKETTTAASSASSSSGSGSKSSTTSSSGSTGSSPSPGSSPPSTSAAPKPSKPSAPAKKTIYLVALQFGLVPAGTAPEAAQLTPYTGLAKATPLPSKKERLLEFVGVTVTHEGVSASFAVDGEVILGGSATCLPSPTQCRVIDLKEGKTEQLQYLPPSGPLVTYELRVVSISKSSASTARVSSIQRAEGRIARRLLATGGALRLAGLRFSGRTGVLVFVGHPAFGARASAKR